MASQIMRPKKVMFLELSDIAETLWLLHQSFLKVTVNKKPLDVRH